MLRAILISIFTAGLAYAEADARRSSSEVLPTSGSQHSSLPFDGVTLSDGRFAMAAANTTLLASYSFNFGASCNTQGWTAVDMTTITTVFWHVDDFAGANVHPSDNYSALAGSRSLWCGLRANAGAETCGYALLPGYGNNWNQAWQTKQCIPVTGLLDVSFLLELDTEDGYDTLYLESNSACDPSFFLRTELDGGVGNWDGIQTISHSASYAVGAGPVLVRLRFASDGGFSDEDGIYDSHGGPVVIDNLAVEGLAMETFEDESVGATTSNDWEAVISPGYGQHFALFPGTSLVQQDACAKDLSCVWAAISGSTVTYACGGFPQQLAVPYGNDRGQYIHNEIWSPLIALSGNGGRVTLRFSVYRDLALPQDVFYLWSVRSLVAGCFTPWQDRGFVYFGAQKDWFEHTESVGDLLELANASHIQVSVGIIDMCGSWCGPFVPGDCHSHAPLLDNVRVYRVDIDGPVWSTRDIDMFQDTFPIDGTDTGIGRADAALSITPAASPTILPGDSARVIVRDPITASVGNASGLATDNLGGGNGDKACYMYVNVSDNGVFNPAKSGAILSGGPQYPFKDTVVADGKTWTRIQCWLRVVNTSTFVVDLNDNLFQAGDQINFFFGATNTNGQTTYCSGSALTYVQDDLELAAEAASEFSILPIEGNGTEGSNILYVDGIDGRGGQEFWDTAFDRVSVAEDRYDVRGPQSNVSNRLASRVTNVSQQINANYKAIFWDTGDLSQTLGDGTTASGKTNDYAMLMTYLNGPGSSKGVYIGGDDAPSSLSTASGLSAVTFRTDYISYVLEMSNHRPAYGTNPLVMGKAGGPFAGNQWVAFGGCPLLNDFDVMSPTGTTVIQSTYGPTGSNNGAELSQVTGSARVMLGGFSFVYIRDDQPSPLMDRYVHLIKLLLFFQMNPIVIDAGPLAASNRLEQNYPNPFNPATTIAFSIKQAGQVRIDIYNVAGERVRTLVDERRPAGSYTDVRWDGTNDVNQPVASGVYWYRLVAGSYTEARKMVLLK